MFHKHWGRSWSDSRKNAPPLPSSVSGSPTIGRSFDAAQSDDLADVLLEAEYVMQRDALGRFAA
jgi:hypothetical protein